MQKKRNWTLGDFVAKTDCLPAQRWPLNTVAVIGRTYFNEIISPLISGSH